MQALTDLVINMKDSISVVANVLTNKYVEGDAFKESGSPGSFANYVM